MSQHYKQKVVYENKATTQWTKCAYHHKWISPNLELWLRDNVSKEHSLVIETRAARGNGLKRSSDKSECIRNKNG